jgi:hypothetical protein
VQGLLSSVGGGVPAVQEPVWHVSEPLHTVASLQAVPFGLAGFEQVPVEGLQVPASWQVSDATQTTGFAPVQVPAWQVSAWVQALLSEHVVPSGLAGFEQVPLVGLQVPALWHWSDAAQTTGFAPVQMPLWQVSVWVHALASLQAEPFVFAGFEQTPVDGLQVPTSWHWSDAVQVTAVPATQVPVALHASAPLHWFESAQLVPAATGVCVTPPAGVQASVVQGLLSFRFGGVPATQVPVALQVSAPLQALLSEQLVPAATGVWTWLPFASQVSVVQGLLSL